MPGKDEYDRERQMNNKPNRNCPYLLQYRCFKVASRTRFFDGIGGDFISVNFLSSLCYFIKLKMYVI